MLAADARCKVFDAKANGYVRSEGAAVILIKPLRKAIEDQNQIHAVIKGSSINHGGLAAGLTVPNPQKQSELLVAAWKNAGISAQNITYIEAHGTGTSLGDPIEIQGIQTAYSRFEQTKQDKICGIGSVKSNLGHLESAAGITGLLKVILSMKHRVIPPTIHFSELNPMIHLEDSPFYIQDKLQYFNTKQLYLAGISSFGSGGANAHVVVQEYVSKVKSCNLRENYLFVLSAANQERLCEYAEKIVGWLEGSVTDYDFGNAIFTWQTGRVAMKCRLAIKVKDKKDLQNKLKQWIVGNSPADIWFGRTKSSGTLDHSNRQLIEQALANNDIEQLGILWTSGIDIDWHTFYTGKGDENIPQLISLPTYPFAKDRYWVNGTGIAPQLSMADKEQESATGALSAVPVWQLRKVELPIGTQKNEYSQQYVLLCDMSPINAQQIEALIPDKHCLSFSSCQKNIADQYVEIAQACFQEIQKIFANNQQGKVLVQIVVPYTQEQTIFAGLSGLLKTANLENPSFIGQLILTDPQIAVNKLAEQLWENQQPEDLVIKYESAYRYALRWKTIQPTIDKPEITFKNNGVYLITGGLGGLGVLFAKEILHHTTDAKIIFTGRSELTADKQLILDQLSAQSVRLIYKQLDINQRDQVESLIATIKKEYQTLNGIIHCAGMIAGNFIPAKTLEEFRRVLTPKVIGTSNLDFASRDINLDFFVLFSSIASVIGDLGLSDYALANGFMDQFAAYRNQLVAKNERQGKTFSINWPLWKEGGIVVDLGSQVRLLHTIGMMPMQTSTGIKSFHQILSQPFSQVMVIEGLLPKIEASLKEQNCVCSFKSNVQSNSTVHLQVLYEKVLQKVKQLFAKVLKFSVAEIDENEALLSYGIDSIFINQLNLELSNIFCAIPKTLFFEYQTLADLTKYLVEEYIEECLSWTGLDQEQLNSQGIDNPFSSLNSGMSYSTSIQSSEPNIFATAPQPIAIIGVSGIYPDAANIGEYWENLKMGKNSISEIPSGRWTLEDFYEPDKKNALKEGKSYCKYGGFINQFSQFDPLFFGISPREAMNMDPQERLFLQASYHALEDSGYTRNDLKNKYKQKVGVFAGITKTGFDLYGSCYSYGDEKFHPRTSFGSVANRVSYCLDINGPSMPVDTMCSSSLTAIHEACEHIIRGECSMAFAGGVNLYLHPSAYVWLSAQHMLSKDGYCRSFGAGANGFVPGEGVGVLLLKPLSQAIQDNDNIQGVILSTHVNHGGKVNGYFVPNPNAQAKLIRHAIEKAGINARDISYIEAHGTGTDLGDPIEIRGLQQAFAKDTQEIGYCKIGSVKSNIGHLESAAGIAGLTKILLQMKHRQIAPSLHSKELNPNVDFQKTPFIVNQQLETWDNHVVDGIPKSRIAGVSSFGAGGVNAHVIVQEFVLKPPEVHTELNTNVIIPLSAKTEKQLKQKVQELLSFIRTNQSIDLQAMAYTLQVGREAMDERLAFIVNSLEQLLGKLQAYIAGEQHIEGVFQGQIRRDKNTTFLFNEGSDLQQTVGKWINQRELTKLLDLWVKGLEIDWNKFYNAVKPQRISLPTYPFADERYWIDSLVEQSILPATGKTLHPLLHANTSDFYQQTYSSVFTGNETLIQDYQINGQKVLPSVAYLEMVRAAVLQAMSVSEELTNIKLYNVEWIQPFVANDKKITIALFVSDHNEINYEIYSEEAEQEIIHCQGQALFSSKLTYDQLPVETLKEQMRLGKLDIPTLYSAFTQMNVKYGKSFQGLDAAYLGEGQLLAELKQPVIPDSQDYYLHPGLMDSVLQACMALMLDLSSLPSRLLLPAAVESVTILSKCTSKMYAWVRHSKKIRTEDAIKLDIDLCDQYGNIYVKVRGLEFSGVENSLIGNTLTNSLAEVENTFWDKKSYLSKWEEQVMDFQKNQVNHKVVLIVCSGSSFQFEKTIQDYYEHNKDSQTLLIRLAKKTRQVSEKEWLCGIQDQTGFQTCLKDVAKIDAMYFLSMTDQPSLPLSLKELADSLEYNEIQLLRLVKCLKQNKKIEERVDTYLLTMDNYSINHQPIYYQGAGVNGFGYSLAQGNYQFLVRNIDLLSEDLKKEQDQKNIVETILNEFPSNRGEVFKFQSGKRYRQTFIRQIWNTAKTSVIKQNGVYLIVGGRGTVGQVITRNLIRKYQAKVIWIGRNVADSEKVRKSCLSFEEFGKKLFYVQADVTDITSMEEAIKWVKEKHAAIHGAVFAGMVFDFENSIDRTTEAEFRNILNVKTLGSWNFYTALKQESLDFMCYFSSGQAYSFSGASKLSAYATGITFSDSFVQSLEKTAAFPVGIINWGFWRSSIKEEKGISTENLDALEDQEGFECFEQFVNELEQRRVKQILCMKASPQVESLMNCNREEHIILTQKQISYPVLSLEGTIEIPHKEISVLKKANEQNELDEWLIQLLYCKIRGLLESNIQKKSQKISDLPKDCNIIDKYVPWWNECINLLSQKEYILLQDGVISDWKLLDTKEILSRWQTWKEKYCQGSDYKAHAILANDCLEKLPGILTGKILATDVVFPNASMEKVEGVYKNNHLSDTFNEIIANTVVAYLKQRIGLDPRARLRMLEIGAGTGGTSAVVFSKIRSFKDSIEEYCYTDLSKAFFFHAEEKYGAENPYLHCQRLDIGRSVEEQGIEIGIYDLVIATNVLHATKNIRQTLRNAKALLHPKGFLLINELSDKSIFNHLTFGLLDGWWLFEDPTLRIPNCPALYPASWQQVLEEEGFSSVLFPAKESHDLGQQIIVAQSDGVVRQKVSNKSCKQNAQPVQSLNTVVKKDNSQLKKSDVVVKLSQNTQEYVLNNVLDSFSNTLKISSESINSTVAFSDYGLDSILGVNFIDQINKRLSILLNTAVIFEYSTVIRLSEHIVAVYREQIEKQMPVQTELAVDLDVNRPVVDVENPFPQKRDLRLRFRDKFYNEKKLSNKRPEIAVVGISGKFPKAENVTEFWKNLIQGIDGISELPDHYLDRKKYFTTEKQIGKTRCKWGGILEERDCFDPLFFKISAKEAEAMSPHQRLVLQESWKAIENAGYNPNGLSGTQTGVFIGAEPTGYMGDSFTGYSDAIIASRLSYYANLNGPAFVVNTGCSSSAVALHVACESLRNEETDLAIAGGVYAYLNQKFLVSLDEIGMLSPTGRCFTFDSAADGTVLSEGIGIVVLKRLEDAVAAGDFIYGVICGSGINQDGASNGITAPNGVAQEKLITDVYNRFRIDPEKISYVEAHGTGTNLGDPVEANALIRAFNKFTTKQNFCCIGSAKSHIGHTSSAAGVIGLIKILMSMRHKQIPKLLNFKTLNPLIDFNKSPFYINTDVTEWKSKENIPRMAALNSFGHSGTNAHLVVKEYLAKEEEKATLVKKTVIIPLSAKTSEQLRQKACDLLDFIHEEQFIDLESMAYTLQVGREAMDERLGFVVSSIDQLVEKLQAYIDGAKDIEGVYQGKMKRDKDLLSLFSGDTDLQETIEKWISHQKFSKLLTLWVNGLKLDFQKLYGDTKPKRVVLPAYPFAKERYWIDASILQTLQVSTGTQMTYLHPILHHNTSNLNQQSYDSTFSGEEFFLKDHQVNGQKMLPAVAYLEMARVAVEKAVPVFHKTSMLELHNIVWVQPVVVAESKTISIALYTNDANNDVHRKIDYEIYGTNMGQELVYCQGLAVFCDEQALAKIDLALLKKQMNQRKLDRLLIYKTFSNMGIHFGLSHQGISVIHKGEKQLLAQLNLPDVIDNTFNDYVLHPCLMDSAIQAFIGLIIDRSELLNQPLLPFALKTLRVISACKKEMMAWVRYSSGSSPEDKIIKFDIDLCDMDGNVCVQMQEFTSRVLEGKINSSVNNHIKEHNSSFNEAFYQKIIKSYLDKEVSIDEVLELF